MLPDAIIARCLAERRPPVTDADLFVTESCTLSCDYCFVATKNPGSRMAWEVAQATVDFVLSSSGQSPEVSFHFMGGEPSLEFPLVVRTAEYASRRGPGFGAKPYIQLCPFLISHRPRSGRVARVATAFQQNTAAGTLHQWNEVRLQRSERLPDVAAIMRSASDDGLTYVAHPVALWPVFASTNSLERLNCEMKRRTDVVQIFPDDASVLRLIGGALLEQHEGWQVVRRQISQHAMGRPSTKNDALLARGIQTGT